MSSVSERCFKRPWDFSSETDLFILTQQNMSTSFQELGLQPELLQAITEMGFTAPTEIQAKAIPAFLSRETDLVALAQTGTGKTAAFGLPMLQNIDRSGLFTQGLVISPTRELCLQITNDLAKYSKYMPGIQVVAVYGGSSITEQVRQLRRGAHIIVATPGRLIDLIDRKAVKLERIQTVVLDEADEMLNMGFQEDMENILSHTPEDKITGLFSATMPKEIRQIAQKYLRESVEVSSGKKNSASTSISHRYSVVHAREKLQALKRIIDFHADFFGIVFCTTRIETQEIADALIKAGYNADSLHGDLSQQQRDQVMGRFRKRTVKILCATDVAARGIDVNDITHVIHFHLPDDIENYTHRSGRTARAGKSGISIALLHIREAYKLHQIERTANIKFEKYQIPKGEQIIAGRIERFVEDFCNFDPEEQDDVPVLPEWIAPLMEMKKEELVQRLLARELATIDRHYLQQPDLNVQEGSKGSSPKAGITPFREKGKRRDGQDFGQEGGVRIFINVGKKDGMRYDEIRELIFRNTKVSGHHIRDIDMGGVASYFDTDANSAERILQGFRNVEIGGRPIRVDRADGIKARKPGGGAGKSYDKGGAKKRYGKPAGRSW